MSTFEEMVSFLDATWDVKTDIVPCLVGAPGIGKTYAVWQHAKNVGANNVVTIIASQILPNEVSGITMPDERTRSMEIYDHYRLSSLKDGDILFFDELLEADQSTLSACLTLIESRMMMSGKLLPDIQIIAATNPTIKPMMLKPNIRQRFMFMEFDIDKYGTQKYLRKKFDVNIPIEVLDRMTDDSDIEYNFLTPRSITKLCKWFDGVSDDKLKDVANIVDKMFSSAVGTELKTAFENKRFTPEKKAKKIIVDTLLKHDHVTLFDGEESKCLNDETEWLDELSMDKFMGLLTALPDWEDISNELANINLNEDEIPEEGTY